MPLSESLWLQTYYTFSRDQIYGIVTDPTTGAPVTSRAISDACGWDFKTGQCTQGAYYTSLVGTTLTYDRRNHPTNPTSGYYLSAGVDVAGLGGDVQYVRGSAEARGYYPIAEKVTFVGRVLAGDIEGWGGQDVRLLDLFFKGDETVRGFQRSGYGPRDISSPNQDALGGRTYWAATAEIRFPIPALPDDLGISGAVFADAGSLFNVTKATKALNTNCGLAYNPQSICLAGDDASVRSSVGGSILWASPVGPLRMDFAQVLTQNSADKDQFFRFGASTKF
jgi:outer membrane protein insertion porin family